MTETRPPAGPHETAAAPTRCAVVLPREGAGQRPRGAEARMAEAVELARSIGLEIVHTAIVTPRERRPATLLGPGPIEELG
jgi:GTPase